MAERERRVLQALASRSAVAAAGPSALAALLAAFLPQSQRIRWLVGGMISLAACRMWIALQQPRMVTERAGRWRTLFSTGALATALTWGACAGAIIVDQGGPAALLVLLMTAGIAAGAVVSMGIERWLVRAYLTLLLAPPSVALVASEMPLAWATVASVALFGLFMVVQAELHRAHFFSAFDAERLLSHHAEQLRTYADAADRARSEAESASSAKSSFLANISHELRTPLSGIIGYADLLLGRVSDRKRIEYAGVIRRNGDHLLSLLNDLLDLSKIEAGKMTVVSQEVSLRSVIADVQSLMCVRATERGLSLRVLADTPFPRVVRGDSTRLRQILLNLVGNAIKFTNEGEVRVRVHLDGVLRRLFIDVEDTGPGMSSTQQSKLFLPFSQTDDARDAALHGTGLGLHISRRLAQLMDGNVEVRSEPGVGSVFSLWLPIGDGNNQLVEDPLGSIRPSARDDGPVAASLHGIRVLVADDSQDNRVLFHTILSQAGANVEVVEDGERAVDAVLAAREQGTSFDVVLMDMDMPTLDGYGATARLRAAAYEGAIIALTAHAMGLHRERTLAAGCSGHLIKPIERRDLVDAVGTFASAGQGAHTAMRSDELGKPLESSLADDPVLGRLIPKFLDGLTRTREQLIQAAACDDRATLSRLAHQLAGAGGSYGYDVITDTARELESLAVDASRTELSGSVAKLVALCDRAVASRGADAERASSSTPQIRRGVA